MLGLFSNLLCNSCVTACVLRSLHHPPPRWSAQILDGRKLAKTIHLELKAEVEKWVESGNRPPKLVALLIGDDPASMVYVRNKIRASIEIGIISEKKDFPFTISQVDLITEIESLNNDPEVDGILVQLPLPEHIQVRDVCNAISPEKDVDGFNVINMGRMCLNMEGFVPCTALGVHQLLKSYSIETRGKNVVVCGRSRNVGLPMSLLLQANSKKCEGETLGMNATTTICHRNTPPDKLKELTRIADIVISAAGVPNLITADMIKVGACIIDIGINRIPNDKSGSKLVGDVDFEGVVNVSGYITPVPGGIGPMTVAMLMKNTIKAAKRSVGYEVDKLLMKHATLSSFIR